MISSKDRGAASALVIVLIVIVGWTVSLFMEDRDQSKKPPADSTRSEKAEAEPAKQKDPPGRAPPPTPSAVTTPASASGKTAADTGPAARQP